MTDRPRNPLEALTAHAAECAAWKDAVAARVKALVTDGEPGRLDDRRAEIALLELAQDRCISALVKRARLEMGDRQARCVPGS